MKLVAFVLSLAVSLVLLSACGLLNVSQMYDIKIDDNGNRVMADTKRNWEFFVWRMDSLIRSEANGGVPYAGSASWNEWWVSHIRRLEEGRGENVSRYINYIIDRRREAGLPEIVGYEPAK